MKHVLPQLLLAAISCFARAQAPPSQNVPADNIPQLSPVTLGKLVRQYDDLDKTVQRRAEKALDGIQKTESRLWQKLQRKDSAKAAQLFAGSPAAYQLARARLQSPDITAANPLKEYLPGVDSMQTALRFLQQKGIPLSAGQLQQVQLAGGRLQQLQARMQAATDAQQFVLARAQLLKEQLSSAGPVKQLTQLNSQVSRFHQDLTGYKALLTEPGKWSSAALNAAKQLPAFNSFMQKNSILSQLFPASPNDGTAQALTGLQTRSDIKQALQQRYGQEALTPDKNGGGNFLQQQVQAAQLSLSRLKDKLNAGGGDITMPGVAPAPSKNIVKRLQPGFNIQSQQGTSLLPVTSDLALTLGYKLSKKAVAGIGLSYKMGWGDGLNHMHLSSQGLGFRGFIDIQAKGSIWVTGSWEYNYYQAFTKLSEVQQLARWQKSALAGLTKKYKIGRHEGNMQLLYDVLSVFRPTPVSPLRFRVGYNF